ncbi:hypothetical protein L7F22_012474 [Adiantum nelumboides]|nr:hypothetical protein [Adiantum nelumboides]
MGMMESRQLVCLVLLLAVAAAVAGGKTATASGEGYCDVMTGHCGIGSSFMIEEAEMSRRMLIASLGTRYISYGALISDRVPCSQAGRSYYGCRGSGPVNPYTRGCSRITHCYRDVS